MTAMLLALVLAAGGGLATADGCFPAEAPLKEPAREWYCRHVRATGLRQLVGDPSFRFIYLPTFHAPRIVWVARESEGLVLRGVLLSGMGGYEAGRVVRRTQRVLTPEEWRLLQQRAENAGMWEASESQKASGTDGSRWILEGTQGGAYRFHDLWTPTAGGFPQFVKVCSYMLELAGLKPDSAELY